MVRHCAALYCTAVYGTIVAYSAQEVRHCPVFCRLLHFRIGWFTAHMVGQPAVNHCEQRSVKLRHVNFRPEGFRIHPEVLFPDPEMLSCFTETWKDKDITLDRISGLTPDGPCPGYSATGIVSVHRIGIWSIWWRLCFDGTCSWCLGGDGSATSR